MYILKKIIILPLSVIRSSIHYFPISFTFISENPGLLEAVQTWSSSLREQAASTQHEGWLAQAGGWPGL